ncbi:M10 family metallopeptidase C-terminal domain-containing protein [Pararhodobacter sp. CCB-MM2]|uniref:M10 family metallopeptidase C-terminal domain-containing protein n=1 Tax=Pararhodobacter sp. CCB-MM2 TaxID=1786003 RepID=UPI00082B1EBE|nr:M10 family metallopeptidase C-terminal domain-containing protein [Pararhodobacter sp. CCB-MM2]
MAREVIDAAGNTGTAYSLAIDDYFDGAISSAGDTDWVRVSLIAGQTYVFAVHGTGGPSVGLYDTYLGIYNGTGTLVASNDDLSPQDQNYFSAVSFTPTTSGAFYLGVESYGSETGDYRIMAADETFNLDQIASYMLDLDWGQPAPWVFDAGPGDVITVNISALTPEGQQLAAWALEAWGIATGITFQGVTNGGQILFDDTQSGAFAGPNNADAQGFSSSASVNIGTDWLNAYGAEINSYSLSTYLHEIGHALGLGHGGPYDGNATYGQDNLYANDSYQTTVMSYFSPTANSAVTGSYFEPITPMPADYIAMERAYGLGQAYTGNTTWGVNSNVPGYLGQAMGFMFDGDTPVAGLWNSVGSDIGFTIFDTGGTDTFNLSGMSASQSVDLRPTYASSVAGGTNNVWIARGTIIENARGGTGNDVLMGNHVGNLLIGNTGSDLVVGLGGNDTMWAGAGDNGDDSVFGGAGADIAGLGGGDDLAVGDGYFDGVTAYGETSDDGQDTIYAGAGDDLVITGGYDGSSAPTYASAGNGAIAASVTGRAADTAFTGKGRDILYGADGNDVLGGGFDADYVHGGGGNDTIYAGTGSFADTLVGGDGNDLIYNGGGNDKVFGGAGADELWGGAGDDTLTGGAGADTFCFTPSNGSDVIVDFENGTDTILIEDVSGGSDAERFANLSIDQIGSDAVISVDALSITVQGVNASALDASDFYFL